MCQMIDVPDVMCQMIGRQHLTCHVAHAYTFDVYSMPLISTPFACNVADIETFDVYL